MNLEILLYDRQFIKTVNKLFEKLQKDEEIFNYEELKDIAFECSLSYGKEDSKEEIKVRNLCILFSLNLVFRIDNIDTE